MTNESELLQAILLELNDTEDTPSALTVRYITHIMQEAGYEIREWSGSSARPAVREHPQRPVPKHPWANQKGKLNGDVALERVRGSYVLLKRLLKGVNEGYLKDEIARRARLRERAAYAEKRMQEDLMESVEPAQPTALVRTTKSFILGASILVAWVSVAVVTLVSWVSAAVIGLIGAAFLIAMSPVALVWLIVSTPAALMDAHFDSDFFYYRGERERHLAVRLYRWAREP
jgi:hypothetical protein